MPNILFCLPFLPEHAYSCFCSSAVLQGDINCITVHTTCIVPESQAAERSEHYLASLFFGSNTCCHLADSNQNMHQKACPLLWYFKGAVAVVHKDFLEMNMANKKEGALCHLETKHPMNSSTIVTGLQTSEVLLNGKTGTWIAFQAPYLVLLQLAKSAKPCKNRGNVSCALSRILSMLHWYMLLPIKAISLSNDPVSWPIHGMAADVWEELFRRVLGRQFLSTIGWNDRCILSNLGGKDPYMNTCCPLTICYWRMKLFEAFQKSVLDSGLDWHHCISTVGGQAMSEKNTMSFTMVNSPGSFGEHQWNWKLLRTGLHLKN